MSGRSSSILRNPRCPPSSGHLHHNAGDQGQKEQTDDNRGKSSPGHHRSPRQERNRIPAGFDDDPPQLALVFLGNIGNPVAVGVGETPDIFHHPDPFLELLDTGLTFIGIHPGSSEVVNRVSVQVLGDDIEDLVGVLSDDFEEGRVVDIRGDSVEVLIGFRVIQRDVALLLASQPDIGHPVENHPPGVVGEFQSGHLQEIGNSLCGDRRWSTPPGLS